MALTERDEKGDLESMARNKSDILVLRIGKDMVNLIARIAAERLASADARIQAGGDVNTVLEAVAQRQEADAVVNQIKESIAAQLTAQRNAEQAKAAREAAAPLRVRPRLLRLRLLPS
jgi:methylmalonyl-CoA mutase cobalamin-binding subunit